MQHTWHKSNKKKRILKADFFHVLYIILTEVGQNLNFRVYISNTSMEKETHTEPLYHGSPPDKTSSYKLTFPPQLASFIRIERSVVQTMAICEVEVFQSGVYKIRQSFFLISFCLRLFIKFYFNNIFRKVK